MARNRRSARQAGTRTERAVADYLADTLDDRIDRRVKTGATDKGDIGGVRTRDGQRIVIEVKDCATQSLPQWTREARIEADNDNALVGVVVAKRRGTTDPGEYWVHMTLADLVALISGKHPDAEPAPSLLDTLRKVAPRPAECTADCPVICRAALSNGRCEVSND